MAKRLTYDEVKHFIEVESGSGCKLISEEYVNSKTKLFIECKCGVQFQNTFDKLKNRNRLNCINCSPRGFKKTHEKFLEEVYDLVNDEYLVLGKYVNCHTKIKIKHAYCKKEYDVSPSNFIGGKRCPYCSNQKVSIGFNDMWTTNPKLASTLANPEDGYKYTCSSGHKVDWRCTECGYVTKNKRIYSILKNGIPCVKCSDGYSFGEKFMYWTLREADIEFEFQKTFNWRKDKIYDFFLPNDNTIIEVHGSQHSEEVFGKLGGRSLTQEIENDILKMDIAKLNGVKNYVIIDARYSNKEYLIESIHKSSLKKILCSNIDFDYIDELASSHSLCRKAWGMWNSGLTIKEIAFDMSISTSTIRKYLKRGRDLNKIDYTPSKALKRGKEKVAREVVGYNKNEVRFFPSASEAKRQLGINSGNLLRSCKNLDKKYSSGGYRWMYKEDYDAMIAEHGKIIDL